MASVFFTHRILRQHFGWSLGALRTLSMYALRSAANTACCALDRVLYPQLAAQPFDRPVFILGNPRSGTTLLHRFLAQAEPFCGAQLWEMLFPALCTRRLLQPLVERIARRYEQPAEDAAIHETGPLHAETDDAYLLLQHLDGPLAWCAIHAWQDRFAEQLQSEVFAQREEARLLTQLEALWRRNLLYHRRSRLLVKSSTATAAIPAVLSRYPDARLLYLMRSPLQVVPSALSLVEHNYVRTLSRIRPPSDAERTRYFENVYQMMCLLYRRFHEQCVSGAIPAKNLRIVSYRRLTRDFAVEITNILGFVGVPAEPWMPRIAQHESRQREHRSQHRYTLERFGLSEQRIRHDLAFVFQHYEVE